MLEGIAGSFSSRARTKFSGVACAGDSVMKTSVLPHHTITRRSRLLPALNVRMSAMTCSARSILFFPFLTFGPSRRFTYRWSNTADMGLIISSSGHAFKERGLQHTGRSCGRVAVVLENIPAPEHEIVEAGDGNDIADLWRTAFGPLPETNRAHLRQRSDRLGKSSRMARTPAIVVVLTAPRPTSRIPSLPRAGAISTGVDTKRRTIYYRPVHVEAS